MRRLVLNMVLIIGAIAIGGFLVYKFASSSASAQTPGQTPGTGTARAAPRRTANTTADSRNVAPVGSGSGSGSGSNSGAGSGLGADGGGNNTWTGFKGSSTPAAAAPTDAGTGDRFGGISRLSGLNSRFATLRVDIPEDKRFGIDALPDDGEGSLRALVRSMIRIYMSSAPGGTLGLYPWDADFVRGKADVLVSEFGAAYAAKILRRIAGEVEAAYALRQAINDADDAARAAARFVDRARRSFPAIMALPSSGKLAGELQSIALHLEWQARITGGSVYDDTSNPDIDTRVQKVLTVPAGESYAPPNSEQIQQLRTRAVGVYGESSGVVLELNAIRDAVVTGNVFNTTSPESASFSYGGYISAATSAVGDAVAEVVEALPEAPESSGSGSGSSGSSGSSGITIKGGIGFS